MKLIYTANARFPSEKAHPYQIMQMCEAFAQNGLDVTLVTANRRNTPDLADKDVFDTYDIERVFEFRSLPTLDVYVLETLLPQWLLRWSSRLAAALVMLTYHISLMIYLTRHSNAIIYTRNIETLFLLNLLRPRLARRAFYEAHIYPKSRIAHRMRRRVLPRIGGTVTITGHLTERYQASYPIEDYAVITEHDAVRPARFQIEGDQATWRRSFGWPDDAFIVGYIGRFESGLEGMNKGITTLIDACITLQSLDGPAVYLALVGGPAHHVEGYRTRITTAGLKDDWLLYPGSVSVAQVPAYLRAFDVCTIPSPWNEFYAYYTSPLKLFEYMMAGKAIVASDLPSTAEIIRHGENGILAAPGDTTQWIESLQSLRLDSSARQQLGAQAKQDVQYYTWRARASRIKTFMLTQIGEA